MRLAASIGSGRGRVLPSFGPRKIHLLSRYLDSSDRRAAPLFGDGAGAVVLQAAEEPGSLGAVVLGADSH